MADLQNKLYQRHNTDGVFVRSVIAGLLNLLNNEISYSQVWDNDTNEEVVVPWYYNFAHANNERFLQDNYTFFGRDCFNQKRLDTDFNTYPKGILTYKGSQIDAASFTNMFCEGKYMKNENGVLNSYTGLFYSIPLSMTFECTVLTADTDFLSMLKIEQALREVFYKNKSFYVLYHGMRIGCTTGFPEQYSYEPTMDLTYDNAKRENKMTFTLAVEAYQPAFDETTVMPADASMTGIGFDIYMRPQDNITLEVLQPKDFDTFAADAAVEIKWNCHSDTSELYSLCIDWLDENGKVNNIVNGLYCYQNEYIWNIPSGLSTFEQPEITLGAPGYSFVEKPIIKVIPINGMITDKSFVMISPGKIKAKQSFNNKIEVPFNLEYTNDKDEIIIDDNYKFLVNNNGSINLSNPVKLIGDPVKYQKSYSPKDISLRLTLSNREKKVETIKNIRII